MDCPLFWGKVTSPGQIDPVKETVAAKLRIENNLSTYSRESAELNGTDFERNIQKLKKERALIGTSNVNLEEHDR